MLLCTPLVHHLYHTMAGQHNTKSVLSRAYNLKRTLSDYFFYQGISSDRYTSELVQRLAKDITAGLILSRHRSGK